MKKNYHTHTYRCGHASGSEEDMVVQAIASGLDTIGISCHSPLPYFRLFMIRSFIYVRSMIGIKISTKWILADGFGSRLPYRTKDEHLQIIKELKEKYKDQITIYAGFEAEWFVQYVNYFQSLLDNKEVDYLILGLHYDRYNCMDRYYIRISDDASLVRYGQNACYAMDTGLFSYFCHPDLFMTSKAEFNETCQKITRDICHSALKNNVPLEVNAGGFRRGLKQIGDHERYPYPHDEFWKIVSELEVPVVLGLDAHAPEQLCKEEYDQLEAYAKRLNLKVIDTFEFKKGTTRSV